VVAKRHKRDRGAEQKRRAQGLEPENLDKQLSERGSEGELTSIAGQ
jgi:hypothetical protein